MSMFRELGSTTDKISGARVHPHLVSREESGTGNWPNQRNLSSDHMNILMISKKKKKKKK